jgi:hypothetical protein
MANIQGTAANNTALGAFVASTTLATGSSNILIGVGTGNVAGGADTPASGTNNFLNIGNTLEGNMANANAISGEALYLNPAVSSVNYVSVTGGATGTGATVAAAGTDTNVNLTLSPQGSGSTIISTGTVGIGTATVPTGLKVAINGPVMVAGTGSEPCNAATVGQMRYNPTGQYMEICTYP